MEYKIAFDNNTVEETFLDIHHHFEWSESSFESGDLMRTIVNSVAFEKRVNSLRLFGASVETGGYMDGDFLRIGFARINDHVFVKNGKINYKELKDALWEIAHPAEKVYTVSTF